MRLVLALAGLTANEGETTEEALMSNLLMLPAELLASDATDAAAADRVLDQKVDRQWTHDSSAN